MNNSQIAEKFSLLAKLMDIHGENSFKTKSYSSAAFAIENSELQLCEIPPEKISTIKGIGASTSQKVIEILKTGQLKALEEIIFNTPPGVIELLKIKGLGPKKINTIWKEMQIESVGELLYACQENRLKTFKGFGEKTQLSVIDTVEFYLKSKESFLYSQVEKVALEITSLMINIFGEKNTFITGNFKRQLEIINHFEFVINGDTGFIKERLNEVTEFQFEEENNSILTYKTAAGIRVKIHSTDDCNLVGKLISTSASTEFIDAFKMDYPDMAWENHITEEAFFKKAGLSHIPAVLRESPTVLSRAKQGNLPDLIQKSDIKGIIHSHSTWSDGSHSIEQMANACIQKGLEYLVITDHSKSAFYANGLSEDRIEQQHKQINELNLKLAPFKVFKGIETDILNDGQLDYNNAILAKFDVVIASVHSNLKMTEDKAMKRLLTAIENPYTTILGHMTGRLLLSRSGYPLDHKKIIDACKANKVVIELNSNPRRLDMDWRHISYAIEQGVLISINPDAHFIDGLDDVHYGVLSAQKAMVTKEDNLSSFNLAEFSKYLEGKRFRV